MRATRNAREAALGEGAVNARGARVVRAERDGGNETLPGNVLRERESDAQRFRCVGIRQAGSTDLGRA